jgi:outer membrane receptor protein involved in Fe transport
LKLRVVVLSLCVAAPGFADNSADEADVAFQLGNEAYLKRDYERALAEYFLSNRLVPNRNVLFNIARVYEAMKRFDEAYRYYNDLVGPELSETDAAAVKAALGRLSPHVALIHIVTTPPGADVFVDREDLGSRGRSPQTLAVPPGAHTVKVRLEGYRAGDAQVTAVKGREVKADLKLTQVLGTIDFVGTPEGALVRESPDGEVIARVPQKLSTVPGQRVFYLSAGGHAPTQLVVNVKPDETAVAQVSLLKLPEPTGKVVITANREAAEVRVDGQSAGFTPTVVVLSVGDHEVEVAAKDLRPFSQVVHVEADSQQQVVADLRYLPPKIGAASKSLSEADDAPASITVISRDEIQAMGYQTLPEALSAVPGFFLSTDRIYTYIGTRGFSPPGDLNTRILILYDGHAFNDVWAGQGYSARDFDIDLNEIDRIEIVRGPGSALYGTGAFFAVINLVPRDTVAGKHIEGVVGAGGLNGGKARATASVGDEKTNALLSAAGFLSAGDTVTDLGDRGVVNGLDGERSIGATARAHWNGFTVSAKINQRRKEIPVAPLGTVVGQPGTGYTDARAFAELRYDHDFNSRVSVSARAYYDGSRFRGTYVYPGDPSYDYETDSGGADWAGVEARGRFKLFEGNTLAAGFEGQYQVVKSQPAMTIPVVDNPEVHTRTLFSGYLLDEWKIFSRLSISLGVRIDKFLDLNALPITPRLGIVARPYNGGLTKVVVGQAFRAPDIYELYFNDSNITQRAALNLLPETITTFELEHSHNFTEEFRVTVAGYVNLMDHLITLQTEMAPAPPQCGDPIGSVQCLVYQNSSGRIVAAGAEAGLRWQPGRFLFVDAHYSFVKLIDAPAAVNNQTPTHLAAIKGVVPLAENYVRLSGQVTYQSARGNGVGAQNGEALLLNLGVSGETRYFRYFAGVQNLLDSRYSITIASADVGLARIPQYGRTFWIELAAGY